MYKHILLDCESHKISFPINSCKYFQKQHGKFKVIPLIEDYKDYKILDRIINYHDMKLSDIDYIKAYGIYIAARVLDREELYQYKPVFKYIKKLDCSYSKDIYEITDEFKRLEHLHCVNSSVAKVSKNINLRSIWCSYSKITEIPSNWTNLYSLWCGNTRIKRLPKELINLKTLNCSETLIEKIPKTYLSLEHLSFNQIGYREMLVYKNLIDFVCGNRELDIRDIEIIKSNFANIEYVVYGGGRYIILDDHLL